MEMETDTPTDDLETNTEIELNSFQQLQTAIASLPPIDKERVDAALKKLRNGKLDILGDSTKKISSAERIAQKIIDETTGTDS